MQPHRRVVVSVGHIPARVGSVKFLGNGFESGLALKTVEKLLDIHGIFVTVVAWKYADIPYEIERRCDNVFRVADVFGYYDWFAAHAKDYNSFIMGAAAADLTPVTDWKGKFPSGSYEPGEEFDIRFTAAPRAIDVIKQLNPKACLIGYELFDAENNEDPIETARGTLERTKADIIFAGMPASAKSHKIALTQDGSAVSCTFDRHIDIIVRAIRRPRT